MAEEAVVVVEVVVGTITPGVFAVTVATITEPGFKLLKVIEVGLVARTTCLAPFDRVIV